MIYVLSSIVGYKVDKEIRLLSKTISTASGNRRYVFEMMRLISLRLKRQVNIGIKNPEIYMTITRVTPYGANVKTLKIELNKLRDTLTLEE